MLFNALKQPTAATIANVNPRIEKHGDDDVLAVDVNLDVTLPNTALTPELLDVFYEPADASQPSIPGVATLRTVLRPGLASLVFPVRLDGKLEGRIVALEHGEVGDPDVEELPLAKVHKAAITPLAGGSIVVSFQVQQSEVEPDSVGVLCGWLRKAVRVSIATSEPTEQKREDSPDAGRSAPPPDVRQQQLEALGAS